MDELELLQLVMNGPTAFALLSAALEFDVFEHLAASEGMDVPAVANALGVDEQPARILLLGLASMRLVRKEGERYVNAPVASLLLVRSQPGYVGAFVEMHEKIINPAMADLTASLRRHTNVGLGRLDGPGGTLYERLSASPELQRLFYEHMGEASRTAMRQVLDTHDFSGVSRLLDLGGGDGSTAMEIARRHPHIEVTVHDRESVTAIAAGNIEKAGLADRVRVCSGDMFEDPLPGGMDAILMSHIHEMWSEERNIGLLRKCRESLPPGGRVLSLALVSADDGTGPMTAAFMSAYFLALASGEGMVYSGQDIVRAFERAGFSRVDRYEEGMAYGHGLFVGTR